jgi:ABC-type antimicrobial peptide transport system permease subunit
LDFEVDAQYQKMTGTPMPVYQIIGVVGDVRTKLDIPAQATAYRPLLDGRNHDMIAVLHTAGDPESVALAARDQIKRLDPSLAVFHAETLQQVLGQTAADRRFSMLLFSSFAGLALLLAGVGLYGVLAYSVTQRRNEIGVRIALGATRSEVRGLMLREGLRPAGAGIVAGLFGAALASQALSNSLFGIGPADPVTFVCVPLVLLAVAAVACYVPAMRATRVDPLQALRTE